MPLSAEVAASFAAAGLVGLGLTLLLAAVLVSAPVVSSLAVSLPAAAFAKVCVVDFGVTFAFGRGFLIMRSKVVFISSPVYP